MNMKQGILLTAVGHPQYGKMAWNLAVTIRAVSDIPIAIITDETALSHLTEEQAGIFNEVITLKGITGNFKKANEIRLDLPKYSLFDQTLALDVDLLWLKKDPYELFSLLSDEKPFTIVNEGHTNLETGEDFTSKRYTYWGDPAIIKEGYSLDGNFYQVRGEFLLFQKSKAVTQLYKKAKEIFRKPKVEVALHGETVTDEFCLNVALNLSGMEPHQSNWQPSFWAARFMNIIPTIPKLIEDYYALSLGGNYATRDLIKVHDLIVDAACYKLGIKHIFPLKAKRKYLTERLLA